MAGTIVADTIQAAATSTLRIQTGNGAPTTAITVSPTQNVTVAGTTTLTGGVVGDLKFNSGYGSVATAYGCRAWVNFNGTGTVAIRASANVTSVSDGGVGVYTINFTNAMPDANFSWAGSANTASTNTQIRATVQQKSNQSNTTLTLPITTMDGTASTTSFDSPEICVSVFR
jgi:hypothetical protein